MGSRRSRAAAGAALLVCVTCARSTFAEDRARRESVARIQISGASGTTDGACVLAALDERAGETVLYFLTAAHLFSSGLLGNHATAAMRVALTLPNGTTLRTSGSHVFFPSGMESGVDVAVVTVISASTTLVPEPLVFDAADVGEPFTIRGPADLLPRDSAQRVRFRSSRLIVGDRALQNATGMVGAPAIGTSGIFGLMSAAGSNGIPIVTLLSGAREFLTRALPASAAPARSARPTSMRVAPWVFPQRCGKVARCDRALRDELAEIQCLCRTVSEARPLLGIQAFRQVPQTTGGLSCRR